MITCWCKLSFMNFLLTCSYIITKVFWNTLVTFLQTFLRVIATNFCVNEYYIHFQTCECKFYVDYHIVCTNVSRYFEDGRKRYFLFYKNQEFFFKIDLGKVWWILPKHSLRAYIYIFLESMSIIHYYDFLPLDVINFVGQNSFG